MATFKSTRKKFPTKWEEGFTYYNELNVKAQDLIKTCFEGFNLNEFYTEKQTKFFGGQATFVWTKCFISANDCKAIIEELLPCVEHYAIITHDKDDAKPHTHMLIKFFRNQWVSTKLVDYFHIDSWQDPLKKLKNVYEYLTHDSDKCRKEGKFQYSKDDVLSDDIEYWEKFSQEVDDFLKGGSKSMIDDMLSGMSTYDLVVKYGDSFVYHRKQLCEVVSSVREERSFRNRDLYELHSIKDDWLAVYDKRTGNLVNVRLKLDDVHADLEEKIYAGYTSQNKGN